MFLWLLHKVQNVKHSSNEITFKYIFRKGLFVIDYFWDLPYHFLSFFYQQKEPPWYSVKKIVFKNFAIFTGRHLCRTGSFFKKVAGLQPVTWSKTPTLKTICKRLALYQSGFFYVPLVSYVLLYWKDIVFMTELFFHFHIFVISWSYLSIINKIC